MKVSRQPGTVVIRMVDYQSYHCMLVAKVANCRFLAKLSVYWAELECSLSSNAFDKGDQSGMGHSEILTEVVEGAVLQQWLAIGKVSHSWNM